MPATDISPDNRDAGVGALVEIAFHVGEIDHAAVMFASPNTFSNPNAFTITYPNAFK